MQNDNTIGKTQGRNMLGTKNLKNETEEWIKGSRKEFLYAIQESRGHSKEDSNSKYYRHILWGIDKANIPIEKCFGLISLFLNSMGLDMVKEEESSFHFRGIFDKKIKIHAKVDYEEGGFIINAHIDIKPHTDVLYNEATSILLDRLSFFLKYEAELSYVNIMSKHHKNEEEQKTSITLNFNESVKDVVRTRYLSKKNQIINEIVFNSIKRKALLNQEEIKTIIQVFFSKNFKILNELAIAKQELEELIEDNIEEINGIAKQRFEDRLKTYNNQVKKQKSSVKNQKINKTRIKPNYNKASKFNRRKKTNSFFYTHDNIEQKEIETESEYPVEIEKENYNIVLWKKEILKQFLVLLTEEVKIQRLDNRISLNKDNIIKEVNQYFQPKLEGKTKEENEYYSKANKILKSKQADSIFNRGKYLLKNLALLQGKRFRKFLRKTYSKIRKDAIAKEKFNLNMNEIKEIIKSSFENMNYDKKFSYIKPYVGVGKYLHSQEFENDFKTQQKYIRKALNKIWRERALNRKEKNKNSRLLIYYSLLFITVIILIGTFLYYLKLFSLSKGWIVG